jgi:hypothetical protein
VIGHNDINRDFNAEQAQFAVRLAHHLRAIAERPEAVADVGRLAHIRVLIAEYDASRAAESAFCDALVAKHDPEAAKKAARKGMK